MTSPIRKNGDLRSAQGIDRDRHHTRTPALALEEADVEALEVVTGGNYCHTPGTTPRDHTHEKDGNPIYRPNK